MLSQNKIKIILFFTATVVCSCAHDKGVPISECLDSNFTYAETTSAIILQKCASPGCHDASASEGDFTSYEGVKEKIDNGSFRSHVFEQGTMPPASSPQLSNEEKLQLKCWIEKGAPL